MFEKDFIKAKGKPIKYKDKTICMIDYFEIPNTKSKLKFVISETNSEWKQGFGLTVKGYFKINNQKVKNDIRLWEHTAPKEAIFKVECKDKKIMVTNIWDCGDGVTQKWHNGGAMYFEEIENGKRYYCNDGHPNDDFNDLIFDLIIIE